MPGKPRCVHSEGEGGLHNPDSVRKESLGNGDADYELPACALQYRIELEPEEERELRFLFGPAQSREEISEIRKGLLVKEGVFDSTCNYREYIESGCGNLVIETPDKDLDNFVNTWLPRQVYYHGTVNRLSTDPQTRNLSAGQYGDVLHRSGLGQIGI